jgi:uncharacterized membrane protein (DUF106 family)
MAERKHTGGTREIRYTKEDDERIRNTDTESTRAFKNALYAHQAKRKLEEIKKLEKQQQQMKGIIILLITLFVLLLILTIIRIMS